MTQIRFWVTLTPVLGSEFWTQLCFVPTFKVAFASVLQPTMPPAAHARRNPPDEGGAEDAIFVKDGRPVSFFFHASIRQGLDILRQEITVRV
jgi:hypothetical protein